LNKISISLSYNAVPYSKNGQGLSDLVYSPPGAWVSENDGTVSDPLEKTTILGAEAKLSFKGSLHIIL
jgi:hypothetical protein